MRICFSVTNDALEDMKLTDHFGESDRFIVFDTQLEAFIVHKRNPVQCSGTCHCHLPSLPKREFDAVICRSIGLRAFSMFSRNRIEVFLTHERDIELAISAWKKNELLQAKQGHCRPEVMVQRRQQRSMRNN